MNDNSMSMEQNADSNSGPPTLVEATNVGNGTSLDYSRCMDPNGTSMIPSGGIGITACSASDSMSAPMEVI